MGTIADFAAGDALAGGLADGGSHGRVLEREIAGRLITLEQGQLLDELSELLGTGVLITHDGQLVLNERMVDEGHPAAIEIDLLDELSELLGTGVLITHDGQLVLNERMVDEGHPAAIEIDGHTILLKLDEELVEGHDLGDARLVATTLKFGGKEGLDDFLVDLEVDETAGQAHHVTVVVLAEELRKRNGRNGLTISLLTSRSTKRPDRHTTLPLLCWRKSSANGTDVMEEARTPATLSAATAIPMPVPHTRTPRSASPAETALATGAA